jgi:hypothetical protein
MADELDTFMFGVNSERIAALEMLYEYLNDPRPVREVIEEIMQRIRARLNESR